MNIKLISPELDKHGIAEHFCEDLRTVETIINLSMYHKGDFKKIITDLNRLFIPLSHRVYLVMGYVTGLLVATHECNELIKQTTNVCLRQN